MNLPAAFNNSPQVKVSLEEPQKPSPSGANDAEIAKSITTLLSHYFLANESQDVRRLQIGDWLDDLEEFAAMHVAEACKEWRRTQNKRPTIADIRNLAASSRTKWNERLKARPDHKKSYGYKDSYVRPEMPRDQTVVRAHWRQIRAFDLTKAEHELFVKACADTIERYKIEKGTFIDQIVNSVVQ